MTQKMSDKAIDTYNSTIQLVLDCHNNQGICDKAFNKRFLTFTYTFFFL